MIAGAPPDFSNFLDVNAGDALIAGADFDMYTFRSGFDVAIPVFSPVAEAVKGGDVSAAR